MAALAPYLFGIVLSALAVFLILLVLVQRGRGGGLTGALGGVGGSSAFGAKAGDVFTKITVVAAAIWISICVAAAYWSGHRGDALGSSNTLISEPGDAASSDASNAESVTGDATTDDATTDGDATSGTEDAPPPATDDAPAAGTDANDANNADDE